MADLPLDLAADLPPPVLILSGQDEFKFGRSTHPLVLTSSGQDEFKFGRSTPRSAGRYTHLVLTSVGEDEFKFGRSTPTQMLMDFLKTITQKIIGLSYVI